MTLNDSDVNDLEARLRALGPGLRRRPAAPTLVDTVRARASRHRARARVIGAAALVVLVAAGVGIPVALLTGPQRTTVVPARQPPLHTFGGLGVTWLPAGLTHDVDAAAHDLVDSGFSWGPVDGSQPPRGLRPPVTQLMGITTLRLTHVDRTMFGSLFTAKGSATTTNPSSAWVTVTWQPEVLTTVDTMATQIRASDSSGLGPILLSKDTVGGRPALVLHHDLATETLPTLEPGTTARYVATATPSLPPVPAETRYRTALLWVDATGVVFSVELAGPTPPDPAVAHRIADGLVLGQQPTIPGYTPLGVPPVPVDAATTAAVTPVLEAAFTGGTPADRWAGAVQDGPALLAVRDELGTRYPGPASRARVDTLSRVDPDTVSAQVALSYDDPSVAGALGGGPALISVTAVRTAEGWKVSRDSFCASLTYRQTPAISCP
ncbi:hypothetical protein [Pseudofrankia saprophytica]|uniref:hypothetical protein n=1 Tax=Pseudofrankia saprophytica TaxID=298655 RepID=UPI000234D1B6|nr:hypothetical protein [Pseudofrankia saprophytica]